MDWSSIDIRQGRNFYWRKSHHSIGLIKSILAGKPGPLTDLTLQVTDRCHLSCPSCNRTSFTDGDMTEERAIALIDEAVTLGLKTVHFTGGEATAWSPLVRVVAHCAAQDLSVSLGSNGYFDEDLAHALAKAGLQRLNLSYGTIAAPPPALAHLRTLPFTVFINHMLVEATMNELPQFIAHVAKRYPFVVDIQLMPPRGTAEPLALDSIRRYALAIAPAAWQAARRARFYNVADKVLVALGTNEQEFRRAAGGCYHQQLTTPCYAALTSLKFGQRGYAPCTYLYRDGFAMGTRDDSVAEALRHSRRFCLASSPPHAMCERSCGPEITNFNGHVAATLEEPLPAIALSC